MHNYSEKELGEMKSLNLRKVAMDSLGITRAEANNTKASILIAKILEAMGGNGNGDGGDAEQTEPESKPKRTRRSKKSVAKQEAEAPVNGIGKLVDAVGKAVDETKEELASKSDEALESLEHVMKQQFVLFGMLCDIYKATHDPGELEARLDELEQEWESQGNV